jgi:hypothetical protein
MKLKHLAVLLALSTIAADCPFGDNSTTGTTDVSGTYTLQSLDGDPLPAIWNDNGTNRTVTSGTVVINANGTFTYTETNNSFSDNTVGTWTKAGDVYTFNPTEGVGEEPSSNGTGTFAGTTFTLSIPHDGGGTSIRVYMKTS